MASRTLSAYTIYMRLQKCSGQGDRSLSRAATPSALSASMTASRLVRYHAVSLIWAAMCLSRFSDTFRYPFTEPTYPSHSFAKASGAAETNLLFIPFLAILCSLVKSHADTVSQYISVNCSSFMSRAMTFPSVRSTISHMAGDGKTTSSPVRRVISSA